MAQPDDDRVTAAKRAGSFFKSAEPHSGQRASASKRGSNNSLSLLHDWQR
jgi:hypothetical protein